jgi:hypothetical protein
MLRRTAKLCSALLLIACAFAPPPSVAAGADSETGVARVRSAYSMQDTIAGRADKDRRFGASSSPWRPR